MRYRKSYDPALGDPIAWLLGIARRCIDDSFRHRRELVDEPREMAAPGDLEEDAARRLGLVAAIAALEERDQELIALRYGADLTARQIGDVLGVQTNTVEVALHRALGRLRDSLEDPGPGASSAAAGTV